MTRYFIGEVNVKHGEYEFGQLFKFIKTDEDERTPEVILDNVAKTYYPVEDEFDSEDGSYYFNGGEICVTKGEYQEITEEIFKGITLMMTLSGREFGV